MQRPVHKRDENLRAKVRALHTDGLSYRAIGAELGLSKTRVQTLVREMGLTPHPRVRPRQKEGNDGN